MRRFAVFYIRANKQGSRMNIKQAIRMNAFYMTVVLNCVIYIPSKIKKITRTSCEKTHVCSNIFLRIIFLSKLILLPGEYKLEEW